MKASEEQLRAPRVLVVDDNLQNRLVVEGNLVSEGIEVLQAEDGLSALQIFTDERPDLVLLDVMMPGIDGFETCRRLRRIPGSAEVPILFLTALNDLGTHERAMSSGADDFLTKPLQRTELLLRVNSLLRVSRLHAERRAQMEVIALHRDRLLAARARNRALTRFLVHDLKIPLSVLAMGSELLAERAPPGDPSVQLLEDMVDSASTLQRMILDILDVSRNEEGRLEPNFTEGSISAVVQEVCRHLRPRFDRASRHLQVQVDGEEPARRHDRDLIARLVSNLLDNALRYAPAETRVRVEIQDPAGEPWSLAVRDEGAGIPEDQRDRIFEEFGQADSASAANRGLGLTFCRVVADLHGGRIWAEPNEPTGTAMRLEIPA